MTLLDSRSNTRQAVLEGRYIQTVLKEEGENINQAQREKMSGFSMATITGRNFKVVDTTLVHIHQAKHRFIDMKRRKTSQGSIKKVSYPIHNKPIYGVLNNIIRRLSYGFTEATKQQMMKLDKQDL